VTKKKPLIISSVDRVARRLHAGHAAAFGRFYESFYLISGSAMRKSFSFEVRTMCAAIQKEREYGISFAGSDNQVGPLVVRFGRSEAVD
jgi:hypothetical protein